MGVGDPHYSRSGDRRYTAGYVRYWMALESRRRWKTRCICVMRWKRSLRPWPAVGECACADFAVVIAAVRSDDFDAVAVDDEAVGVGAFDLILDAHGAIDGKSVVDGMLAHEEPGAHPGSARGADHAGEAKASGCGELRAGAGGLAVAGAEDEKRCAGGEGSDDLRRERGGRNGAAAAVGSDVVGADGVSRPRGGRRGDDEIVVLTGREGVQG